MKRILGSAKTSLAAIGLLFIVTGFATAEELGYASYVPPAHPANKVGLVPFFAAVKEASGGNLNIKLYDSGSIVGEKATLAAVRDRLVDGGLIISSSVRNELPYHAMLGDLGPLGTDVAVTGGAINETILLGCPECYADYKKNNVIFFAGYAVPPYRLLCTREVSDLKSLQGAKVRTAGDAWSRMAVALGGVAVRVASVETYEALQRGQLDCAVAPISWMKSLNLVDVVTTVLDEPIGTYQAGTIIALNADSWKSLSDAERKAFVSKVPLAVASLTMGYSKEDVEVFEATKANKKITYKKPTADIMAVIEQQRAEQIQRVRDDARKRGLKNADEVIDTFLKNLEKWRGIIDRIGHDQNKYAEALDKKIYSRVTFK